MSSDAEPPEDRQPELPEPPGEPALFQHPQWMSGIVLILALASLYAGVFGDPVWLLIGSPFIVTLAIYFWARFVHRR